MHIRFESQTDLEDAMQALVAQDPRLKPILAQTGMPALRQREPGFAGLAHIVCGQQVSTASAAAIWRAKRSDSTSDSLPFCRFMRDPSDSPSRNSMTI